MTVAPWHVSAGGRPSAGQSGWIGLTTLVWAGAVCAILLLGLTAATDLLTARTRAQTAADAAALAAVGTSPLVGGDAQAAAVAGRVAERNSAELVTCDCGAIDTAEVVVAVPPATSVRHLVPTVRARARAELQPRAGP